MFMKATFSTILLSLASSVFAADDCKETEAVFGPGTCASSEELKVTFDDSDYLRSLGLSQLIHKPVSVTFEHPSLSVKDDKMDLVLKSRLSSNGTQKGNGTIVEISYEIESEVTHLNDSLVTLIKYKYELQGYDGNGFTSNSTEVVLPSKTNHVIKITPQKVEGIYYLTNN